MPHQISTLDDKTLTRWYNDYQDAIKRCNAGWLPWMLEFLISQRDKCKDELKKRGLPYTIMLQPK